MTTVRVEWYGDDVLRRVERAADRGALAAASVIVNAIKAKLSKIGRSATSVGNARGALKRIAKGKQPTKPQQRTLDALGRAKDKSGRTVWVDKAGGSPRLRSGSLRQSIQQERVASGQYLVGSTKPTGTGYAAIHEFGGVITPKKGRFLWFPSPDTGELIPAKKVTIPARPYMRPGFIESNQKAVDEFSRVFSNAAFGEGGTP